MAGTEPEDSAADARKERQTLRRKIEKLDNRDLINTGFWVAQIFLMASTVLGVYLAAQVGLKQAVLFDEIDTTENRYKLLASVKSELNANLEKLDKYANKVANTGQNLPPPRLQKVVWKTLPRSPTTLKSKPGLLTRAESFYFKTDGITESIEDRSKLPDAPKAAQQLKKHIAETRNNLIQDIEAQIQSLNADLEALGAKDVK